MKAFQRIIAGIAIITAMITSTSCSSTKPAAAVPEPPQKPVLKSPLDTVSYALGVNIGSDLKKSLKTFPEGPPNIDIVADVLVKALKGDTTLSMSNQDAQNYIQQYVMAAQQRESEAKKVENEKFLTENKTKEGVVTTESGLQYKILTPGTGEKPVKTDQVKVHYTGKLLDGTVFDSSVERGKPATFGVAQVISGWQEVLQLMPVGSKYQVWVPSDLAYGASGAGQMIKPHSTLEFEIELLEIIKPEKTEETEGITE